MSHSIVILIIDDSKGYRLYLKKLIKYTNVCGHPIEIISVDNIDQAIPQMSTGHFDIIFVDDVFPKSKMTGRELLKSIQGRQDEHHVLISGRKLIKKPSMDDVMQIKMISKRNINKLYMGKIISAVFEEQKCRGKETEQMTMQPIEERFCGA
jgi:DNA-binding NtrC family response regulator